MYPFHLAFAVKDLEETKHFFLEYFKVSIGRECDSWVDFDFYGHQLSAHLKPEDIQSAETNAVDGKQVPVRHFGLVLPWTEWHELAAHLQEKQVDFLIAPYIRFEGETGEQATMFVCDPSGNAIELKSFKDPTQLFAR